MRGFSFTVGLVASLIFWVGVESVSAGNPTVATTYIDSETSTLTSSVFDGATFTASGLTINIVSGRSYQFRAILPFASAATATGVCVRFAGTSLTVSFFIGHIRQAGAGTDAFFSSQAEGAASAYFCSSASPAATSVYLTEIAGHFLAGETTALELSFSTEVNGSTVTLSPGNRVRTLTVIESNNEHNHDDRYFTESESDARFAPVSHNHDDRYFTESESDARFSAAAHLHDSVYCNSDGTETDPDCASGGGGGGAIAPCDTVECLPAQEFDEYVLASHTCGDPNADPPQDPCEVGLAINDSNALQDIRETNGYLLGALAGILVLSILLWTFLRAGNDPE